MLTIKVSLKEGYMEVTTNTQSKTAWHRWFRRTNVYIAEYILMLIFVGALLGILTSLWYSFFGMLAVDGAEGKLIAVRAAVLLGSLVVVCPAAYWLYARVTGQEMIDPKVVASKARTVFLTIWMIGIVVALVSIVASSAASVISSVFSLGDVSGTKLWVGDFIPSILAVVTLACGVAMVVKHVSRTFVLRNAFVVAGVAAVLLVANVVMISMRKDFKPQKPTCTISAYYAGDCSYQEYRKQNSDYNSNYSDGNAMLFNSRDY